MMDFTAEDIELLDLVQSDLIFIRENSKPEADDHSLRRISGQLRHLLVDQALLKAWRLLQLTPKQPTIITTKLDLDNNCDFAVAGGGQANGIQVANVRVTIGRTLGEEEIRKRYEAEKDKPLKQAFTLQEFKDSSAFICGGKKIKREQVIKYVANKKGGVHLDTSRKKDEEAYRLLDQADNGMLIAGKKTLYLELLSIWQALTSSNDIERLILEINKVIKDYR